MLSVPMYLIRSMQFEAKIGVYNKYIITSLITNGSAAKESMISFHFKQFFRNIVRLLFNNNIFFKK